MKIKTCGKCKIDKGVEYFSRSAASEDGLQMYCKKCMGVFAKLHNRRKRQRANAKKRYEAAKNEGRVQAKQPASAQESTQYGIELLFRWLEKRPEWQFEINQLIKRTLFKF